MTVIAISSLYMELCERRQQVTLRVVPETRVRMWGVAARRTIIVESCVAYDCHGSIKSLHGVMRTTRASHSAQGCGDARQAAVSFCEIRRESCADEGACGCRKIGRVQASSSIPLWRCRRKGSRASARLGNHGQDNAKPQGGGPALRQSLRRPCNGRACKRARYPASRLLGDEQ